MSLVCRVVWHFCSVTWNSLSFWCEHGCYWWRSVQRLWADIWLMLGTCARNDMHSLLQLLWVHICVCVHTGYVSVFHTDAWDWESHIQLPPRVIQWASLSISVVAGSPRRLGTLSLSLTIWWEKGIILCSHWPCLEKITHQLAHLSSQSWKLFSQ